MYSTMYSIFDRRRSRTLTPHTVAFNFLTAHAAALNFFTAGMGDVLYVHLIGDALNFFTAGMGDVLYVHLIGDALIFFTAHAAALNFFTAWAMYYTLDRRRSRLFHVTYDRSRPLTARAMNFAFDQ
ncbi:hypothetical protein V498_06919 [Pseudogymnoascus sp. VKM F-4517 (FW-2822)]|nr:hypothetical protein V498_06919 [Pseudogymnoascus sp. VKM F-4517 (FW-2822)]